MAITQSMLDYVNTMLFRMFKDNQSCSTVVMKNDGEQKPTQGNKPSPSSHFTVAQLVTAKNKEYPRSEGYMISMVANTNSMEPVIDDNSVVVSEYTRNDAGRAFFKEWPLRLGDICIYEGDEKIWGKTSSGGKVLIIHSIFSIRTTNGKKEYLFKGYNNFLPDPGWVAEESILGRAFEYSSAKQTRDGD